MSNISKVKINDTLYQIKDETAVHDGDEIDSLKFTGTPTTPTAQKGTNTDQIASTAFVKENSSKVVLKTWTLDDVIQI